jgi:hypothetical protein
VLLRVRGIQALLVGALVVLVASSLVVGCNKGGKKVSQDIATVDGTTLTAMDVLLAQQPTQRAEVCMAAIQRMLIEKEAKRQGIAVADADVQSELKRVQESAGGEDKLTAALAQQGATVDDLLTELKFQRTLDLLSVREVADKSDDELQAFLKKNQELFGAPEQYKVRAIFAATREKAEQAASRLKKGEDFATVEQELSQAPGRPATWVPLSQIVPASAQEEVAKLGGKGVTAPHEYQGAPGQSSWFVWSVEDHKAADVPQFESIRDQVQLQAKLKDPKAQKPEEILTNLMLEKKPTVVNDKFAALDTLIGQITKRRAGAGMPAGAMMPVESGAPPAPPTGESAAAGAAR